MPPKKRSGSTSTAAPPQAKKSKSGPNDLPDVEWAGLLKESKRWSAVSGSRNVDAEYRYLKNKDGEDEAYEYICICQAPWEDDDDNEEEEESDEEEEAAEKTKKSECDGGKTCLCRKPAAEHPEHHWIVTNAGYHKFLAQRTMTYLRCPDMFDMYIHNDFYGYGILEVLENLLLDYVDAQGSSKEQWVVVQAIAWFLMDHTSDPMQMIDDGDRLDATVQLAGRVFVSMLATLESENLLTDTSEVKDLGLVMALYMQIAKTYRDEISLLQGRTDMARFDNYILAYSNKHGIPLVGPEDIDAIAAKCDGTVKLPAGTAKKPDPWGAAAAIKKHEKEYGMSGMPSKKGARPKMGGDNHDIMSFTSAERKASNFDKKDPLGKRELDALKSGLIPMRA